MKKIVIGFLVVGLVGVGTFFWQQSQKKSETQAFAAEKIENIQLVSSQWDIVIKKGTGDKIEVEAEGLNKAEQLEVKLKDHRLKIQQKGETKDFFGGFSFGKTTKITVRIPENRHQEMDITSGTGNISMVNITSNKLSSSTKSGDIFLTNVKGAVQTIQSVSGDITIKNFDEKGNTTIQSKVGEINVNFQSTPKNLTAKVVGKEVEATILEKGEEGSSHQAKKFGDGKNQLVIESPKGSIFLK